MSAKPKNAPHKTAPDKDAICDYCEKRIRDGQKWLSLPALPDFVSKNGWTDREIYHVTCAAQLAGAADPNGVFLP